MEKLLKFLNSLDRQQRLTFCDACKTTERYLRKAVSNGDKLNAVLCIDIDRESGGLVDCESLRPDADWAYIRGSKRLVDKPD